MGQVITVASGKGGVGKSTVTAGLCASLAHAGKRVLAIDADAGLRGLDLLLGLEDEAVYDLSDVLGGRKRLSDAMIRHEGLGALFFLAAPLTPEDPCITAQALKTLFLHTGNAFDYIVIDSPSGLGALQSALAAAADRVLLVTTPDPSAVRAAARASQALGGEQGLIINRIEPKLIRDKILPHIDSVIDTVAVRLIGLIPEDRDAVRGKGEAAGIAMQNIALRLAGEHRPLYRFW